MKVVTASIHPQGLHPTVASLAWYLHRKEDMSFRDICAEIVNVEGEEPGVKCVWGAVQRVDTALAEGVAVPESGYKNCGRKRKVTPEQEKAIVAFVKSWRSKRFCTCSYIRMTLKLKVNRRTIGNVLNRHGYYWRAVPKVRGLSTEELQKRETFVVAYEKHPPSWWEPEMNLVLDGVTLTAPPKPLNGRQRHMGAAIRLGIEGFGCQTTF